MWYIEVFYELPYVPYYYRCTVVYYRWFAVLPSDTTKQVLETRVDTKEEGYVLSRTYVSHTAAAVRMLYCYESHH